jgi:hypothetical protein
VLASFLSGWPSGFIMVSVRAGRGRRVGGRLGVVLGVVGIALVGVLSTASASPVARNGGLGSSLALRFSGSLTYHEIDPGQNQGAIATGVVGQGTFALKLTGTKPPVLRGPGKKTSRKSKRKQKPVVVPLTPFAAGGRYVVRYDIDASGSYKGIFVATFSNAKLGSLCLSGSLAFGKFVPGSSFPPTDGTLTTVGGTGLASLLRLTLQAHVTDVTGTPDYQISGTGSTTVSLATAKKMNADCLAVVKLSQP